VGLVLGHTPRPFAAHRSGGDCDLLPILCVAAVLGARLYYVALGVAPVPAQLVRCLGVGRAAFAIPWGLIAATLAGLFIARAQVGLWNLLDVLVPRCLGSGDRPLGNFF